MRRENDKAGRGRLLKERKAGPTIGRGNKVYSGMGRVCWAFLRMEKGRGAGFTLEGGEEQRLL